ncbi:uncharacterized protein LOC116000850 isoform X2 [Ipomoea triloba]|uniref:uncharacterized protein LOC116000850 isoform X2 n=1 Tax=Ipomoea triloba TaxID=35885 RepID=UPI00125E9748|nr:uncharacterized protein LOC116000850 isoform X2 [Ipomoea triloba]
MPYQYRLASQICPLQTRRTMEVQLLRAFEIPEMHGGSTTESKGRVVKLYSPPQKVVAGKNSRLMDFLIEEAAGSDRLRICMVIFAGSMAVG